MIPIMQQFPHNPNARVIGDCHRAAWASVLELPIGLVPHFAEGNPDAHEFIRRESEWLLERGYVAIIVPFNSPLDIVLAHVYQANPGIHYLLTGTSRYGMPHTVVGLNDKIVHDPSLDRAGVVRPCEDRMYWVTYLGSAAALAKPRTGEEHGDDLKT